ncbi:hypothetical protein V8C86DRAFT_2744504, partial [Haematococcus lacustris]
LPAPSSSCLYYQSCLADSLLPPCWLLLYAVAALLATTKPCYTCHAPAVCIISQLRLSKQMNKINTPAACALTGSPS